MEEEKKKGKGIIALISFVILSVLLMVVFLYFKDSPENAGLTRVRKQADDVSASNAAPVETTSIQPPSTQFEPTKSLAERKKVNAKNYLNGSNFELTKLAEALGYKTLDSSEIGKHVAYAMYRDGIEWFFVYDYGELELYANCGDGFVYSATTKIPVAGDRNCNVIAKGQDNRTIDVHGAEKIANALVYLATTTKADFSHLAEFETIKKYEGPPKYYQNGLLMYRYHGNLVSEASCRGPDA